MLNPNPNITVNVTLTTPEAVAAFMAALNGTSLSQGVATMEAATASNNMPPAPTAAHMQSVPAPALAAVPVTHSASATPQPPVSPAGAPLSAPPEYTFDALAHAAAPLMDAGKTADLQALLRSFNVQALTQLPKEQYGAFATALRELGARI